MDNAGAAKTFDSPTPKTYFAPPERASRDEVEELSRFVQESPLFQAIEQAIDGYLMILNPQRQILATNSQLVKDLAPDFPDCLVGKRVGEAIQCIHAQDGPGGCGTSLACATCGAVIATLGSQATGQPVTEECLATVSRGGHTEPCELRVRAAPLRAGEHDFTVLVFQDISGDKRRQVLEQTFFHDILNTVGGLLGWSSMLSQFEGLDSKDVAGRIVDLSRRLKREIQDQRRLSKAEQGNLALEVEVTTVREIMDTLDSVFTAHDVAKKKKIEFATGDADESIATDSSLLVRVLTNMIKNALEASEEGETVRVWHERRGGDIVFSVHNPGAIPDRIARRMFQRSFTTRGGPGRGIGTYSMKLFGERYLGGKVSFTTGPETGTIFSIQQPVDGPPQRSV